MTHTEGELLVVEEITPGATQEQATRGSFRVPLSDSDKFFLEIDGHRYPLLDISRRGVRISVDDKTSIASQGAHFSADLILGERSFHGLEGTVVHYSLGGSGGWVCGLQWLDLAPGVGEDLDDLVSTLRKELFTHD